eukprot:scaffold11865_cov103-Isochrysis_galbana.AAC.4
MKGVGVCALNCGLPPSNSPTPRAPLSPSTPLLTTHAMSRSSGSRQAENASSALCTGSGRATG